jgi:hypothetical protein
MGDPVSVDVDVGVGEPDVVVLFQTSVIGVAVAAAPSCGRP